MPAGVRPTLKDWETHLTTIFPEVRLKRYMEMRGGDGGPLHMVIALPALWVGLLYDRCTPQHACLLECWAVDTTGQPVGSRAALCQQLPAASCAGPLSCGHRSSAADLTGLPERQPCRRMPAASSCRCGQTGLPTCREAQQACYDLIRDWTPQEHQALRAQVPKDALQTPFRSTTVQVPTV